MRVTLLADNQFGPDGPQGGTQMDARSFTRADGEIWLGCTTAGRPGWWFIEISHVSSDLAYRD